MELIGPQSTPTFIIRSIHLALVCGLVAANILSFRGYLFFDRKSGDAESG